MVIINTVQTKVLTHRRLRNLIEFLSFADIMIAPKAVSVLLIAPESVALK